MTRRLVLGDAVFVRTDDSRGLASIRRGGRRGTPARRVREAGSPWFVAR